MKIVLQAFGKLESKPMDVPENTTPNFMLALNQPITAKTGYAGQRIGEIPELKTIAEFEWTGKSYSYDDGGFARIYVLKDIYKN